MARCESIRGRSAVAGRGQCPDPSAAVTAAVFRLAVAVEIGWMAFLAWLAFRG